MQTGLAALPRTRNLRCPACWARLAARPRRRCGRDAAGGHFPSRQRRAADAGHVHVQARMARRGRRRTRPRCCVERSFRRERRTSPGPRPRAPRRGDHPEGRLRMREGVSLRKNLENRWALRCGRSDPMELTGACVKQRLARSLGLPSIGHADRQKLPVGHIVLRTQAPLFPNCNGRQGERS